MSEKIGGAKGTELEDDFILLERRIDVLGRLVEGLIYKTHEFLQPNPAIRAKTTTRNALSKMRGQDHRMSYQLPEGTLGEHMQKHAVDLGEGFIFGSCLQAAGDSFKHLEEIKYNLEDNVKRDFLEPLHQLQNKDLKEVNHHRKKLSGRRLDYDCKKRKKDKAAGGSNIPEEDLRVAEEKFEESKELAYNAMLNVIDNEVEYISQLQAFIEAEVDYHRQAVDTLQTLLKTLEEKLSEAASRPKTELVTRRVSSMRRSESPNSYDGPSDAFDSGTHGTFNSLQPAPAPVPDMVKKPTVRALYDFEPENEGELGFSEGDIIDLLQQIDENWYEGSHKGNFGFFPVNYVEVVVPL